jgi:hypothetical protein
LATGKELQSLREHPDSVVCVRYDESSQLAFTVSKCFIKVWDLRESPNKFVKTMSSNGITEFSATTRQGDGAGEPRIHEVQLNSHGTKLFSTCAQIVRVWDLRMFHAIGKLNSNHQSNITCMAVEDTPDGYITVVTGSKDRYLKVFDFPDGAGGCILPRCTFEPPHLDGVSAIALNRSLLFSASRDGNIKQWDLKCDLGKNLNSNHTAHKDSVLSLHIADQFGLNCDLPRPTFNRNAGMSSAPSNSSPLLISSCKGGRIKLWDAQSFTPVAEIKAHQASVHSVYSNSSFIFTGSSYVFLLVPDRFTQQTNRFVCSFRFVTETARSACGDVAPARIRRRITTRISSAWFNRCLFDFVFAASLSSSICTNNPQQIDSLLSPFFFTLTLPYLTHFHG